MGKPTDDTEFDLCSDSVTLDYDALHQLALVAVRRCMDDLHSRLGTWHKIGSYPTNSDAHWMAEAAQDLYLATVALHFLHEGLDKEEIKVTRACKSTSKQRGE